jgi:hypothetical protein
MAATCWPWFSPQYRTLASEAWTKTVVPSGCGAADASGNVPCSPEAMRATSEAWLAHNYPQAIVMLGGRLDLDTYTFARYMHSEVGSGTVEERIAVGEAGFNRAKLIGKSISQLLMPSGYYGPIHGSDALCTSRGYDCSSKSGVCCAPFGRWAATSRDPSIMSVLLAHLVVSGASGNFSNGADDQDGPDAWVKQGQTALTNYVRGLANNGKYWVGPLPGVNHWHTFLQFTPNFAERAVYGKQWLQRGIDSLTLPMVVPDWSGSVAVCTRPVFSYVSPKAGTFLVSMLGLAAGSALALLVGKRYLHLS